MSAQSLLERRFNVLGRHSPLFYEKPLLIGLYIGLAPFLLTDVRLDARSIARVARAELVAWTAFAVPAAIYLVVYFSQHYYFSTGHPTHAALAQYVRIVWLRGFGWLRQAAGENRVLRAQRFLKRRCCCEQRQSADQAQESATILVIHKSRAAPLFERQRDEIPISRSAATSRRRSSTLSSMMQSRKIAPATIVITPIAR